MWPWAHVAVGYLLFSGVIRRRTDTTPVPDEAWLVLLATQLPDLIDKPLAWTFGVLPSGRSLAHSLLFTALALCVLWYAFDRLGRPRLSLDFAVGYASHLAADAVFPLDVGDFEALGFLGWPVVPAVADTSPGILAHFASMEFTTFFWVQAALTLLALVVWVAAGTPGLEDVRRLLAAPTQ